ncbi:TPA: substrate-binding domain-containing protein, partial [Serratia marcescens]
TTLKQPTYQMGHAALERLVQRIQGLAAPSGEQMFSGELIVRGSTTR